MTILYPVLYSDNKWTMETTSFFLTNYKLYLRNPVLTPIGFGALYNWFAATDVRKITKGAWHVPSLSEWVTLENYLGGSSVAGRETVKR